MATPRKVEQANKAIFNTLPKLLNGEIDYSRSDFSFANFTQINPSELFQFLQKHKKMPILIGVTFPEGFQEYCAREEGKVGSPLKNLQICIISQWMQKIRDLSTSNDLTPEKKLQGLCNLYKPDSSDGDSNIGEKWDTVLRYLKLAILLQVLTLKIKKYIPDISNDLKNIVKGEMSNSPASSTSTANNPDDDMRPLLVDAAKICMRSRGSFFGTWGGKYTMTSTGRILTDILKLSEQLYLYFDPQFSTFDTFRKNHQELYTTINKYEEDLKKDIVNYKENFALLQSIGTMLDLKPTQIDANHSFDVAAVTTPNQAPIEPQRQQDLLQQELWTSEQQTQLNNLYQQKQQLTTHMRQVKTNQEALLRATQENSQTSQQLKTLQVKNQQLLANARDQLNKSNNDKCHMTETLAGLEGELKQLEQQSSPLAENLEGFKQKLNEFETTKSQWEEYVNKGPDWQQGLNSRLAELSNSLSILDQKQKTHENVEKNCELLLTQKQKLEAEVKKSTDEMTQCEQNYSSSSEEIQQIDSQLQRLAREEVPLSVKKQFMQQGLQRIADFKLKYAESFKTFEKTSSYNPMIVFETQEASVKKSLEDFEKSISENAQKKLELEKKKSELQAAAESINLSLQNSQSKTSSLEEQMRYVTREIEVKTAELKKHTVLIQEIKEQQQTILLEEEKTKTQLTSLKSELEKAPTMISQLDGNIDICKQKMREIDEVTKKHPEQQQSIKTEIDQVKKCMAIEDEKISKANSQIAQNTQEIDGIQKDINLSDEKGKSINQDIQTLSDHEKKVAETAQSIDNKIKFYEQNVQKPQNYTPEQATNLTSIMQLPSLLSLQQPTSQLTQPQTLPSPSASGGSLTLVDFIPEPPPPLPANLLMFITQQQPTPQLTQPQTPPSLSASEGLPAFNFKNQPPPLPDNPLPFPPIVQQPMSEQQQPTPQLTQPQTLDFTHKPPLLLPSIFSLSALPSSLTVQQPLPPSPQQSTPQIQPQAQNLATSGLFAAPWQSAPMSKQQQDSNTSSTTVATTH